MLINDLPDKVLENILSFLSLPDLLNSTLISRRFAEVFNESPFMNNVRLRFRNTDHTWRRRVNWVDEVEAVILNSNRQYKNVQLNFAGLSQINSAIWTKIGMSLRELEFIDCNWSSEEFYSVLLACPNLESLTIQGVSCHRRLSVRSFELPSGMNLENIQESTRNLRHLHLKLYVNADMLEHMLVAMPSVSSIALSRVHGKPDLVDRLPSMLGTSRGITSLDLDSEIASGAGRAKLLRISSNTLRELEIRPNEISDRERIDRQLYEALVDCRMLRHLRLAITSAIDDDLLRAIIRNSSQLEFLKLDCYRSLCTLSHRALMPILELTQLRDLYLDLGLIRFGLGESGSDAPISNEFLRNLGRLSSLKRLTLHRHVGDVDHVSFQNWANLRNLRYLQVESLSWNANCLRTFPFNLRNLRKLIIRGFTTRDWRKSLFGGSASRDDEASTVPQLSESERKVIESAIVSTSDCLRGKIKSSYLEYLSMTGIPLTDVGLTCIAAHHDRLKYLYLWDCKNITNAGLLDVVQRESLLEELTIGVSDSIDNSFLEALTELCPRLRSLDLYDCAGLSRSAVKLFRSRRPEVEVTTGLALYSP